MERNEQSRGSSFTVEQGVSSFSAKIATEAGVHPRSGVPRLLSTLCPSHLSRHQCCQSSETMRHCTVVLAFVWILLPSLPAQTIRVATWELEKVEATALDAS